MTRVLRALQVRPVAVAVGVVLVALGFVADAVAFEVGHHLAFILGGGAVGYSLRR